MASDAPMTASPAPPTSAPPRDRLSDKQLVELLELTRGADSVELKLTIPLDRQRSTVFELGMDPLDAQIRMVYFFDTLNLDLDKAGVIVRGRRIQGKPDDTVVKLRPVSPQNLPDSLRSATGFVVEVDAMPGGYVCSGSYKAFPSKCSVDEAGSGAAPLRKLFSKQQREFYREHAPQGIELDDLAVLGPVFVLKAKGTPRGARSARSPSSAGCTLRAGSSSCRPAARPARRCRWRPRPAPGAPSARPTCSASNRPRPKPHWTTSQSTWPER